MHPVLIWFTLTCETMKWNCSFAFFIFVFNELTAWNMFQHIWILLMDHTESKAHLVYIIQDSTIIVCVINGCKDFYILDAKKLWWIISQSKHCRRWAAKFSLLYTKQYLNTGLMWRGYEQVKIMSETQFCNRLLKLRCNFKYCMIDNVQYGTIFLHLESYTFWQLKALYNLKETQKKRSQYKVDFFQNCNKDRYSSNMFEQLQ